MTHHCHQDATCANNVGSYECNCLEGFTGGGDNTDHGAPNIIVAHLSGPGTGNG